MPEEAPWGVNGFCWGIRRVVFSALTSLVVCVFTRTGAYTIANSLNYMGIENGPNGLEVGKVDQSIIDAVNELASEEVGILKSVDKNTGEQIGVEPKFQVKNILREMIISTEQQPIVIDLQGNKLKNPYGNDVFVTKYAEDNFKLHYGGKETPKSSGSNE